MEATLKVIVGISDPLERLAREALRIWGGRVVPEVPPTQRQVHLPEPEPQAVPEPEAQAMPEPEAQAMPEPEPQAAPEPEAQAMPEPEAQAAPEPEPQAMPEPEPAGNAVPDDETMRTMMDIAISKVCGTNDWKESQDSRVVALRRSCTGCFREISRRLGAEKPTALQGEGRNRFLSELDNIYVDTGQCKAVWHAF